jgi:hypothetical protein
LLPDAPCVAAVDIRGGAPGTRDIAALDPACLVQNADAIVLSGGSVFGLEAAGGVTAKLSAEGRGITFGKQPWPTPVVPSAILFDLMFGPDKQWGDTPPTVSSASMRSMPHRMTSRLAMPVQGSAQPPARSRGALAAHLRSSTDLRSVHSLPPIPSAPASTRAPAICGHAPSSLMTSLGQHPLHQLILSRSPPWPAASWLPAMPGPLHR